MRIAFCDDEATFRSTCELLMKKCKLLKADLEYEIFTSGDDLMRQYNLMPKPYDIIFLDIEICNVNGIELARKIRLLDEDVLIIYITNYKEYVFESFEVSPFRFLVKPVLYENFKNILFLACEKVSKNTNTVYVTTDRRKIRLNCNDILYIESNKRILIFHTRTEKINTYGKLSNYSPQLINNDFVSVHKSYLVNLNYVIELKKDSVTISNGDIIPISEKCRKIVREEHIKFMVRRYIPNVQ